MKNEFKVKVRGCRGSYSVPGKDTIKYGGNTTCIEIRVNNHLVIIDSGSGIVNLGNELFNKYKENKQKINATILFTHVHQDHIQGFPFFKPIYFPDTELNIFGLIYNERNFEETIRLSMYGPIFPVEFSSTASNKEINNINEDLVIVLKADESKPIVTNKESAEKYNNDEVAKIYTLNSNDHPSGGVAVYKIEFKGKSFVFATDIEIPEDKGQDIIDFSKNCNILFHDAQYTNEKYKFTKGFGHSTIDMAINTSKMANCEKLYLFHHDPEHNDEDLDKIAQYAKEKYSKSFMAIEGDEINLLD